MSRRRHELTDEYWEKSKDLFPGKESNPGRTASENRLFLDAVIDVLKTGIPWEDLPARYGKPNTVWKRFTWIPAVSNRIRSLRRDDANLRKKEDAHARRCLGRSRGGLTTKLHSAVSGYGQLLHLILTAGQKGDALQAGVLLNQIAPGTTQHIVVDVACDSDAIREQSRKLRAKVCIRPASGRNVTTNSVTSTEISSDASASEQVFHDVREVLEAG